ncbi:hypothetical protein BCV69DRAFT_258810 [Microstroma glucosiphilum]|uniref:Uncharacterized protein n=1 Tax=Pseudomicrostroma glucosiphilum TaxID=1684307 RepID=A0A316U8P4_9BASI|nr:hypothetical protein BCV69DRAFT_258810 [Pseudomicrostroma glucosiphilum]PWN21539.1 hypothetical protein BCV69DRAFT_258810 [Pseudomicrostroma glucosiphilum]
MDTRKYPDDDKIATAPNTGPGESQLNPGGVAPPTDNVANPDPPKQEGSSIFQSIENPYALQEAINKLESSLDEVIHLFQGERETLASDGGFDKGKEGIQLFRDWKATLEKLKNGQM